MNTANHFSLLWSIFRTSRHRAIVLQPIGYGRRHVLALPLPDCVCCFREQKAHGGALMSAGAGALMLQERRTEGARQQGATELLAFLNRQVTEVVRLGEALRDRLRLVRCEAQKCLGTDLPLTAERERPFEGRLGTRQL